MIYTLLLAKVYYPASFSPRPAHLLPFPKACHNSHHIALEVDRVEVSGASDDYAVGSLHRQSKFALPVPVLFGYLLGSLVIINIVL